MGSTRHMTNCSTEYAVGVATVSTHWAHSAEGWPRCVELRGCHLLYFTSTIICCLFTQSTISITRFIKCFVVSWQLKI